MSGCIKGDTCDYPTCDCELRAVFEMSEGIAGTNGVHEKPIIQDAVETMADAAQEIMRLRAALQAVRDSGLLMGPLVLHDKIRNIVYKALEGKKIR